MMKTLLKRGAILAFTLVCAVFNAKGQTAIDLAGSGNKVTAPYSFDLANGFTLEYDFYMHSLISFNGCVDEGISNQPKPLDTYLNSNGVMSFLMGNGNVAASNNITGFVAGKWYNIAISYNPADSTASLYVNDTLKTTLHVASSQLGNSGTLIIGDRADGVTNADAKFDNVRIWSGARTAGQVAADQYACLTGTEAGLQVMYNMDEGSGAVLHDLAKNDGSSDGLVSGNASWTTGDVTQITTEAISSYTSPSGKYTWTKNGTYVDTLTSAAGCDSIIVVNLTLTHHVYVDSANVSGTHDGMSWATAYNNFQSGVNAANAGDSVFVAQGTYQPGAGSSFSMKEGVKIYGGFAGTESNLSQRDLTAGYTSTLQGNSNVVIDNSTNNLTHAAVLDGFTITGGTNNSIGSTDGGGIYDFSSSPTLSNLIITNNTTYDAGGGIYSRSSSPILTNVTISNNTAQNGSGGGMYSFQDGSPVLTNVTFNGNTVSMGSGGGMYSYQDASLALNNVIFSGNSAQQGSGGGMENENSQTTFVNVVFYNNSSNSQGGGIRNFSSPNTTFINVTFSKNTVVGMGSGGAMMNDNSSCKISNCVFWGNTAYSNADFYNYSSSPTITYTYNQSAIAGTGNINGSVDPFVNSANPAGADGIWGTADDGLRLDPTNGASAIDAGRNDSLPANTTTDVTGVSARIQNTTVDMGAYENGCATASTQNLIACGNYTSPGGKVWATSGTYTDTIPNAAACDSIMTFNLTVNNASTGDTTATACDNFTWYGTTYNSSATPTHVLTNAAGCDSTVTLHLTINHSSTGDTTATGCDNFTWYGTTFTQSTDRTHLFSNSTGCDSLVTLHLTIHHSTTGDTTATACDSLQWYGTYYTATGTATHVLTNAAGCDSTVTLHLTVNHSTTGDTTATACDSLMWYGNYYAASGNYTNVLMNAAGCDSTVTLHLTINHSTTGDTTATACDSLLWYGNYYAATGNYTNVLMNSTGCDSTVTLHLTITSNTGDTTATACDSLLWYGNYYSASGNYTNVLTNTAGCDSTVTLHLTVNHSTIGDTTASACGSFTWYGTTYTSTGTATHVFATSTSCDSTVTLHLTIGSLTASVSQSGDSLVASPAGATYQWIDCNNNNATINGATGQSYAPTSDGSYAVVVSQGPCTDTTACHTFTGVQELSAQHRSVNIYPNPSTGSFTVTSTVEGTYYIVNELGQRVKVIALTVANNKSVNVTGLSNGVYTLIGYQNNKIISKRIVVTK